MLVGVPAGPAVRVLASVFGVVHVLVAAFVTASASASVFVVASVSARDVEHVNMR